MSYLLSVKGWSWRGQQNGQGIAERNSIAFANHGNGTRTLLVHKTPRNTVSEHWPLPSMPRFQFFYQLARSTETTTHRKRSVSLRRIPVFRFQGTIFHRAQHYRRTRSSCFALARKALVTLDLTALGAFAVQPAPGASQNRPQIQIIVLLSYLTNCFRFLLSSRRRSRKNR